MKEKSYIIICLIAMIPLGSSLIILQTLDTNEEMLILKGILIISTIMLTLLIVYFALLYSTVVAYNDEKKRNDLKIFYDNKRDNTLEEGDDNLNEHIKEFNDE